MKYLFVHQNFPGQFLHLLMRLRENPANELVFICEPNDNFIAGCRKIVYRKPETNEATYFDAMEFEVALKRARIVQQMAEQIRGLNFTPDIIIGHHGWGEMLNLEDVWPGVPVLGYHEFYYRTSGLDVGFDPEFPIAPGAIARVRSKNAVNLIALNNPGHGQTPTQFQLSTYPDWAQPGITVLPEGVDLAACRPNPALRHAALDIDDFHIAPTDILITYVARDLEPYRGFHTLMRALPRLHRLAGNLKVVMVGGDGASYGPRPQGTTWRQVMLNEVGTLIDPARVCFPGKVSYELFLKLLQRSDAHVYLTYPFVLSWSLREAMACGCALVASDTTPVREFVTHRKTGLLVDFPNPAALVDAVQEIIEDRPLAARLRRNARAFAEKRLDLNRYLDAYEALIGRVVDGTA